MPVDRLLPSDDAAELIALTRDIADKVLDPIVDEHERAETLSRRCLRATGRGRTAEPAAAGGMGRRRSALRGLPPGTRGDRRALGRRRRRGQRAQPVVAPALLTFGTEEQKQRWLPAMLSGAQIGAYSLSEPQAGSDAGALNCKATPTTAVTRSPGPRRGSPTAARPISHAVRPAPARALGCQFPGARRSRWLTFSRPEEKMGLHAVPTTSAFYDNAHIDADRLIGAEGQGLPIAFSALDSGRLGIAAVAVGIAQAALDEAVRYANERTAFGRKIIDHQGLGSCWPTWPPPPPPPAPPTWTPPGGRTRLPYSQQASIAKLTATDAAMKVTTDAVQVFGGVGYTRTSASNGSCGRPRSRKYSRAPTRSSASSSPAD